MTAAARDGDTDPGLDAVLWDAWLALDLPEGYRAEIIEGSIEVSPTGRARHGILANRLRRIMDARLTDGPFAAYQDMNVIDGLKALIPDLFIAPAELDSALDPDGLGVHASQVALVAEVVSPGHTDRKRDRIRKRRAYARAGIPVYVMVDDYDRDGTVTVLSAPDPARAEYSVVTRVPYGTPVTVPTGPAAAVVLGPALTDA